jgi:hypothetical protein
MAYKHDFICLYYTLYLTIDPVDAWLFRYQSLEKCHFIWNTEGGGPAADPGWRLTRELC